MWRTRLQNKSGIVNIIKNAFYHCFCHFWENNLGNEVKDRNHSVLKHIWELQNQICKILIIFGQKYDRFYRKQQNGNCCKFCDAVDFTLNHGHFEELMFSTHELYFQSHFLNFVKVPNVISCDCDMEKASKCPNKFYWYELVNERFHFLAIAWHGGAVLNQKARHTKDNDEGALSDSEQ